MLIKMLKCSSESPSVIHVHSQHLSSTSSSECFADFSGPGLDLSGNIQIALRSWWMLFGGCMQLVRKTTDTLDAAKNSLHFQVKINLAVFIYR